MSHLLGWLFKKRKEKDRKKKSSIFFEKQNSLNKLTIKYCKTSNLETLIKMSFQGLCKFLLPLCRNSHNTVWNNRKSL